MKKTIFLCSLILSVTWVFIPVAALSENTATDKVPGSQTYRIGAGDVLQITTWKEADFSLTGILVRPDGKITFPLLDDIQAAGRTTLELKQAISAKLKEFVEDPCVTVTVTAMGSQKFYVLGEIARTGEYTLLKSLTVLQAFALAGGFTEWASKTQ